MLGVDRSDDINTARRDCRDAVFGSDPRILCIMRGLPQQFGSSDQRIELIEVEHARSFRCSALVLAQAAEKRCSVWATARCGSTGEDDDANPRVQFIRRRHRRLGLRPCSPAAEHAASRSHAACICLGAAPRRTAHRRRSQVSLGPLQRRLQALDRQASVRAGSASHWVARIERRPQLAAHPALGITPFPSRCPHRFGKVWSSSWIIAAPARPKARGALHIERIAEAGIGIDDRRATPR